MKHLWQASLFMLGLFAFNAQGQTNYALEFDGVDDYATITNTETIEPGAFSMAARIRAQSMPFTRAAVISNGPEEAPFFFGLEEHGLLTLELNGQTYQYGQAELHDNACHHIAFTADEETIKLYLDGSLVLTDYPNSQPELENQDLFYLGNHPEIDEYEFDGLIDDVEIWGETRTASNMATANAGQTYFEDELSSALVLLDFYEGAGSFSRNIMTLLNNGCVLAADSEQPGWSVTTCVSLPEDGGFIPGSTVNPPCTAAPCNLICNGGFELFDPIVKTTTSYLAYAHALLPVPPALESNVTNWGGFGYMYVRGATSSLTGIPSNGITIGQPGVPSSVNTWDWPATGNNAYAGIAAFAYPSSPVNVSPLNTITYTLDAPLEAHHTFDFSFYAFTSSMKDASVSNTNPQYFSITLTSSTTTNSHLLVAQASLTNHNSISTNNGWDKYSHTFALDQAHDNLYDQIQITALVQHPTTLAVLKDGNNPNSMTFSFVDDFSLTTKSKNFQDAVYFGTGTPASQVEINHEAKQQFIRTDAQDNLYVVKCFAFNGNGSTAKIINNLGNDINTTTNPSYGYVLMKYDNSCDRQLLWSKVIGTSFSGATLVADMEVSSDGRIFLLGHLGSALTFPTATITGATSPSPGHGSNIYLAAFDTQGNLLDAQPYGHYNSGTNAVDLAWDESNDYVYVMGHNHDQLERSFIFEDLNGLENDPMLDETLYDNVIPKGVAYIVQVDFANNAFSPTLSYFHYFPPNSQAIGIDVDQSTGHIYALVYDMDEFESALHHFNQIQPNILQLPNNSSPAITSIGSGTNTVAAKALKVSSNKVFVTGTMQGSIDLGSGVSYNPSVSGSPTFTFMAAYNKSLVPQNVTGILPVSGYTSSASVPHEIAVNSAGEPVVSGRFKSIAFNGTNHSNADQVFVAKFSETLSPTWFSKSSGDISDYTTTSIAFCQADPDIFVTCGTFQGRYKSLGADQIDLGKTYEYSLFIHESVDLSSSVVFKNEENDRLSEASEIRNLSGVQVFPNPTSGELQLNTTDGETSLESVEVYDLMGKRVFSKTFNGSTPSQQINLQNLRSGTYLLRMLTERGVETTRIVKH